MSTFTLFYKRYEKMINLTEKEFTNKALHSDDYVFFVTSPFCGTCQLAEKMLMLAELAQKPSFKIIKCKVNEWPQLVGNMRVHQVPCLLKHEKNGECSKLYAFESVTKIHQFLQ